MVLANDNLDLACQAIEKAAMDRAVIDVDEGFAAAYETRRRHREVCKLILVRLVSDGTWAATSDPSFLGSPDDTNGYNLHLPRSSAHQSFRCAAHSSCGVRRFQ